MSSDRKGGVAMAAPWILTEEEQRLLNDFDIDRYRRYHGHGWTSEMRDDMIAVQEQDATTDSEN